MTEIEREILFDVLEKIRVRHALGKNIIIISNGGVLQLLETNGTHIGWEDAKHQFKFEILNLRKKISVLGRIRRAWSVGITYLWGIISATLKTKKIRPGEISEIFDSSKVSRKEKKETHERVAQCLSTFNKDIGGVGERLFILKEHDFYDELISGYAGKEKINDCIREYVNWARPREQSRKIDDAINVGVCAVGKINKI